MCWRRANVRRVPRVACRWPRAATRDKQTRRPRRHAQATTRSKTTQHIIHDIVIRSNLFWLLRLSSLDSLLSHLLQNHLSSHLFADSIVDLLSQLHAIDTLPCVLWCAVVALQCPDIIGHLNSTCSTTGYSIDAFAKFCLLFCLATSCSRALRYTFIAFRRHGIYLWP